MQEEIEYMRWVMNDGPRKAYQIHRDMALTSLSDLVTKGWTIRSFRDVKMIEDEFAKIEVAITKDGRDVTLRWNSFNKGWMEVKPEGWQVIWSEQ